MRRRPPFRVVFAAAAALLMVVVASGCIGNDPRGALDVLRSDRAAHRVRTIAYDGGESSSAQRHAAEMARRGRLYHSPLSIGAGECSRGQNVGYGSSVADVERRFMESAPHRANILNSRFDHVGLGVYVSGRTVWVVQDFIDVC